MGEWITMQAFDSLLREVLAEARAGVAAEGDAVVHRVGPTGYRLARTVVAGPSS